MFRKFPWYPLLVIMCAAAFLAAGYLLMRDYRALRYRGAFQYPHPFPHSFRQMYRAGERHLTRADVDALRGWMTFDYLNKGFVLPQEYLAAALAIRAHRYPNMTIGAFAKEKNIPAAQALRMVQDAVRTYLTARQSQ